MPTGGLIFEDQLCQMLLIGEQIINMRIFYFLCSLYFIFPKLVVAERYPEVLFENSILPKSYFYSQGGFHGDSWIENLNGHLPVSDSLFFTPGNALSLNYLSAENGDWFADIYFPDSTGYLLQDEKLLRFKLYVDEHTSPSELPSLSVLQTDGGSQSIRLDSYISGFQDNMWLSVEVPISDFSGFQSAYEIRGVRFQQHSGDSKQHRLFIDQMEFMKSDNPGMKLTGKAMLTGAEAFERHVDITWQLPLTPSIRYIKIYRSEDGEDFKPVGLRSIAFKKFTDFVPSSDKSYFYKIAWVDYDYRESPFSEIKKVETKRAGDEVLLQAVQRSHVSYFVDHQEFNSGMFKVSGLAKDATVSVKATGVGVLALLVGVEGGFLNRDAVLDQLLKTLKFLGSATNYYGAFPELLDGRTGRPVASDSCQIDVDLRSTTLLMQGLLAARNFFTKEEEKEKALVEQVNALWHRVDWNAFRMGEGPHLYDRWSPDCGFGLSRPIGGYNESLSSYILGIASPTHPLPENCLAEGYAKPLKFVGSALGRQAKTSLQDTLISTEDPSKTLIYSRQSFNNDSVYYGVRLALGYPDSSLMQTQLPFMAMSFRNFDYAGINLFQNQVDMTSIIYRESLDRAESFVSLSGVLWAPEPVSDVYRYLYNPTTAIASLPFHPKGAMEALENYYRNLGSWVWTEYGFRDGVDLDRNWVRDDFDPISQAIVPVMIENAKNGFVWNLLEKDKDVGPVINRK